MARMETDYKALDEFSRRLIKLADDFGKSLSRANRDVIELNKKYKDKTFLDFKKQYDEGMKRFPSLGQEMHVYARYLDILSNKVRKHLRSSSKSVNSRQFPKIAKPEASVSGGAKADSEAMKKCSKSLMSLSQTLEQYFKQIGGELSRLSSQWKDRKYKEFEDKFKADIRVLKPIIDKMRNCSNHLANEAKFIEDYDNTNKR